ncbi:CoaE-domain-containing protein [Gautieria morchelliformis]|nr:CoaE-domain-containing protein [Gautieria morchelliformis]
MSRDMSCTILYVPLVEVIGLTGGIATGKSTVSSLLASHGIPIIDADVLAREVVGPGTQGLSRITSEFGRDILQPDGTLNRPKLGELIFNNDIKRRKLNAIVHPAVRRALAWRVIKCWLRGEQMCVLDVPLLIEVGLWKWMGWVVVVYCSEQVQIVRLMERDGSTQEAASSRLKSQLPITQKLGYGDFVVDNSGTLKDLEGQVVTLVKRLERQVGWWWWRLEWLVPPVGLVLAGWTLIWRSRRNRRQSE